MPESTATPTAPPAEAAREGLPSRSGTRGRHLVRTLTALAAALVTIAGLAVVTGPRASAQVGPQAGSAAPALPAAPVLPAGSSVDPAVDFYTAPAPMPAANGDVIRTQPMDITMTLPAFPGQWPGDAQRILYRSTGASGRPTAVSGALVTSRLPWTGVWGRVPSPSSPRAPTGRATCAPPPRPSTRP